MSDKVNKLIRAFVQRKYPDLNVQDSDTVTIEQETEYGGYCETCHYEEEYWAINVNGKEVHRFYNDLASILNEILE